MNLQTIYLKFYDKTLYQFYQILIPTNYQRDDWVCTINIAFLVWQVYVGCMQKVFVLALMIWSSINEIVSKLESIAHHILIHSIKIFIYLTEVKRTCNNFLWSATNWFLLISVLLNLRTANSQGELRLSHDLKAQQKDPEPSHDLTYQHCLVPRSFLTFFIQFLHSFYLLPKNSQWALIKVVLMWTIIN